MLCFVDLVKICYQSQIKLADLNFKGGCKSYQCIKSAGQDGRTGSYYLTVII